MQCALEVQGELLTDPDASTAALEAHFAEPEHGTSMPVDRLLLEPELPRQGDLHVQHLPSLPDLALGMQALQSGKAPGITCIPAEAFSQAPLAAATAVFPILIKGAVRGQIPIIWRGTRAIALQKPGKPTQALAPWRNIALYDVCAKGIGKAVRNLLCPALRALSTKG